MSGPSQPSSSRRCPRCDCPDGAEQCEHCKVCQHADGAPEASQPPEFAVALYKDDGGTLAVGICPDGSIEYGVDCQPDAVAGEFWNAVTRAAQSASPWGDQAPSVTTDAMVRAAAEAMEDACLALLGRDLGTVHRDDIARIGLEAAARVAATDTSQAEHPISKEQA